MSTYKGCRVTGSRAQELEPLSGEIFEKELIYDKGICLVYNTWKSGYDKPGRRAVYLEPIPCVGETVFQVVDVLSYKPSGHYTAARGLGPANGLV